MPIIPHSISTAEHATYGEKRLHKALTDVYGDSDDVYAWYEPPALTSEGNRDGSKKRFTDFIVFGQYFGVLNLEVKDWKRNKIRKIDKSGWHILGADDKLVKKESPFEQSRRCSYAVMKKLAAESELIHTSGPHSGKLQFPFSYGVVFAHIDRSEIAEIDPIGDLIPQDQILCKDDLSLDFSSKDNRLTFEKRLRNMFSNKFEFKPLSDMRLKVLRKTIWPELVVTPIRTEKIAQPNDLKILDLQQEDFAKSLGEGHYLVRGVAGSGKTLVLAYRARYLHHLRRDWRILFVCYNKSLKNYVSRIIRNLFDGQGSNIDVFYFHELVTVKTGRSSASLPGEDSQRWDERIGVNLRQAGLNNKLVGGKYDAVMIDEAQDFSTEWLSGVKSLLSDVNSLTIALDPAQDVYGRRRVWKEAGIDVVGGRRSRKLKQSYRNTSEILLLAIKFRGFEEYVEGDDDNPEGILVPEEIERHGEKAEISQFANNMATMESISKKIAELVSTKKYAYRDCAIILCSKKTFDSAALTTRKIPVKLLLEGDERYLFDIDEDSVKVITVESSKGLEWKVVFLVGVDQMPRKKRDPRHERNLVYIGITRAQEILHVYYVEENPFLTELIAANEKIQS